MKNQSRSEGAEFAQGVVDNTYIQLTPNRGGEIENPPYERMAWPQYGQAEVHIDHPFMEAHMHRATLPQEFKTTSARHPHVGA